MEPDFYQVDVLHYLNPSLIWVEVINSNKEHFVFEQIGIYGIIPLEPVLNMDGSVGTQKSVNWMPAAIVIMQNSLKDAEEVWFLPTYIDRRSSIFDKNIHKFGNLIIKKRNGKTKDLSKQLLKSGFAYEDVALFHQNLASGSIKTKLNRLQTQEVINQLEMYYKKKHMTQNWDRSVKKQLSVYELSRNFEVQLTARNLEKHNRKNVKKILEIKLKDLEKCKDVEEESVGRGSNRKEIMQEKKNSSNSSLLKRKLAASKILGAQKQDLNSVLAATKRFLEENAEVKHNIKSENSFEASSSMTEDTSTDSKEKIDSDDRSELGINISESNKETYYSNSGYTGFDNEKIKRSDKIYNGSDVNDPKKNVDMSKCSNNDPAVDITTNIQKKNTIDSSKVKSPQKHVTMVAFGPPGIPLHKLVVKPFILETDSDVDDNIKSDFDNTTTHKSNILHGFSDINHAMMSLDFLNAGSDKNAQDIPIKEIQKSYEINPDDNLNNDIKNEEKESKNRCMFIKNKLLKFNKSQSYDIDKYVPDAIEEDTNKLKVSTAKKENIVKECSKKGKTNSKDDDSRSISSVTTSVVSSLLQKKLRRHKELKNIESSSDTSKSAELQNLVNEASDDENIEEIVKRLDLETSVKVVKNNNDDVLSKYDVEDVQINVNPFKNLDGSKSVFVEKLINPILLVHTKKNNLILPRSNIRDIPFDTNIHIALRNMDIKELTRLQSVSCYTILRGHSTFLISPLGSGKTMGYLPAVCRLVSSDCAIDLDSAGPVCIIVCATAKSVSEVENQAKMFFGFKEKVFACYSGMSELDLTTALLNGCDLLITTPILLVRLLQTEFKIDLKRLTTLVLDDCERVIDVYLDEVKFLLFNIKETLKFRANKEVKVQIIVASRKWTDYLQKLAKKAPDTVICFGAYQECVLYSKVNTTVDFIKKENKINAVLEFLKDIDTTKRTVIVCRNDDEVTALDKILIKTKKYNVFSCNSTMNVEELYNIDKAWADYREPILGPILICCDSNVNHLNVTDAHYLIHYSLPDLFSMFCRRFAVLIDNYPSIFKENNEIMKIKVLLEENNVEQLPKILNFCKRCTDNIPQVLDVLVEEVLMKKDLLKARDYVPICENLLALGECPDFWNCLERHSILKDYDEPKCWLPKEGDITFKVLYYHTPASFSARLLTNTVQNQTIKYAQTYSTLSLKMGVYYSMESNKRLHGIPKLGDVCAVAIKQNFFERCQVLKILNHYANGNPKYVLIKLLDEERYEKVTDIYLYYLPDELKNIETHVVRVKLANIQAKDKDITFPDLAIADFKKITDKDDKLFLRGHVLLAIGNCVFVDSLEACEELTSLNETVVKHNFKKELLEKYAIPRPNHITTLINICEAANILQRKVILPQTLKLKLKFEVRWAYLEPDVLSGVYFASARSPSQFFVRLVKFEKCMTELIQDIKKYVEGNPKTLTDVEKGDIVIAKFPDDSMYERARVEEFCDENKVKCFFVDQGDWRFVPTIHLIAITKQFVEKIPFQAIECSLAGVEPVGDTWSEFSTNWLSDKCYDSSGELKHLFLKYFSKDSAEITNGHKYSVALIDTNGPQDIVINQMMLLLNLAKANNESKYLHEIISRNTSTASIDNLNVDDDKVNITDVVKSLPKIERNDIEHIPIQDGIVDKSSSDNDNVTRMPNNNLIPGKLIRSTPLVTNDPQFDPDRWDVYNPMEVISNKNSPNKNQGIRNLLSINHEEQDGIEAVNDRGRSKQDISEDNIRLKKCTEKTQNPSYKQTCSKGSLDSDDFSSSVSEKSEPILEQIDTTTIKLKTVDDITKSSSHVLGDETRNPKLCWRQTQSSVYIKILLIGVENYSLIINDRSITFFSDHNDLKYSFDFELYGGVLKAKSNHSNKGQYILVTMPKIVRRNWLTLTKDSTIRKWIVYDVDSIDTSSDEEEIDTSNLEVIKNIHEGKESDTDGDEFLDDANFSYRKSEYKY